MKLFVTLEIKEIDSGGPRGEELDQMVQDAIEELDFDEHEVSNVKISRGKVGIYPDGTVDHLCAIANYHIKEGQHMESTRRFVRRIAQIILDSGNRGNTTIVVSK